MAGAASVRKVAGRIEPRKPLRVRLLFALAHYWPTLVTLAGWACLTAGVVRISSGVAWYFGAAFYLLHLVGFKRVAYVAWRGIVQ